MAKGHPWDSIPAGGLFSLLDIKDLGIIHRIWVNSHKVPDGTRINDDRFCGYRHIAPMRQGIHLN